jgi:CysZ protein
MGFLRGLWAPFRGAAFVARHGLWLYVLAPLLMNVALIGGTVTLGVHLVRQRMGPALLGSPLAAIGLWVVGGVMGVLFFIVLQPVVCAPFVDVLTEKVELIVRGEHPRVGLLVAAWRSLLHGGLKLVFYAGALALVLALTALTGIGGGITAALSAVLLAYDGFDYPLARRGATFGAKWKYLLVHPSQTLGYCVGATLLYLVPLAIVVAPAFAAVGATLAFLDTDRDTDTGVGSRIGATPATDGGASFR